MKKKKEKKQVKIGIRMKKSNEPISNLDGNLWEIFNISLFSRDVNQVLNIIGSNLDLGTKKYWVATVNPEFVMEAIKDDKFRQILKKTSLNVMDGIGLIWVRELEKRFKNKTSRLVEGFRVGIEILQGKHRDQVASGADLMLNLGEMVAKKNLKMFFLGGWQNRAKKTADFFKKKFILKDNQVAWSEGEPNVANSEIVKKINGFKPDVLLVAYGMKKQEFWIDRNLKDLDVGLVMGVGRSFDYYSGDLKRAPKAWQKVGLEWLYSLIKEPKRFKRQLVLPKFVWKVLTCK
ncbi:MAG: WecB/TagA/CpsF family glycosyltransferase [Candidatus Shapirobacteria bacterium]|nr:WecB/TagA/CpsF family glycosyltransferase [Candidatus Shapirobacteria bacterium]